MGSGAKRVGLNARLKEAAEKFGANMRKRRGIRSGMTRCIGCATDPYCEREFFSEDVAGQRRCPTCREDPALYRVREARGRW